MFDINSADSIIEFAKKLKGKTLRTVCEVDFEEFKINDKGGYGKTTEKYYFKYEPNSDAEPDFKEVGLELKCSPLKKLKNGSFRSKERLVLNIISYLKVHKEDFETSSFWKKNAHLLLVFYLHDKNLNLLDYLIKLVDHWEYPAEDLKIIKHDWGVINQKIKDGKAHELSEGDTFYLGACTKGSTALKSFREQPFNEKKAKQRAYSLKQGYVNHIIANIAQEGKVVYGKIIKYPETLDEVNSIEEVILEKFKPFYSLTPEDIADKFNLSFKKKAKNYFALITKGVLKAVLGIEQDKMIEEFEKADIQVKTIRVEENNKIKQSVSFPAFSFEQIYNESWENSDLKNLTEKKFLFLFFKNNGTNYVFDKIKFWNMPFSDRNEVHKVWLKTKKVIQTGEIIKCYKTNRNGKISTLNYFPNKSENRVWHVRPHGRNALDTNPLPVMEKKTKDMVFTKQCFWMNWDYLRDEIYLK
jgi:DNA mismatch repair protein MutH